MGKVEYSSESDKFLQEWTHIWHTTHSKLTLKTENFFFHFDPSLIPLFNSLHGIAPTLVHFVKTPFQLSVDYLFWLNKLLDIPVIHA